MASGHWHTSGMASASWCPAKEIHTKVFKLSVTTVAMLKVKNAVLDGEIVCLDWKGAAFSTTFFIGKGFRRFMLLI